MIDNEFDQFSRLSFDTNAKSDHITNNMSKTFNSWLGEDNELLIFSMLEMYRKRIIRRLQSRLKAGIEWVTRLPLFVLFRLNKNIEAARNVRILHVGLIEFKVVDIPNRSYTLNLEK